MAPGAFVAPNHHGRHEVAIAITGGNMDIAWGDKMEFTAQLGPGDFAYFATSMPRQKRSPRAMYRGNLVAIRSVDERIAVPFPERQYLTSHTAHVTACIQKHKKRTLTQLSSSGPPKKLLE